MAEPVEYSCKICGFTSEKKSEVEHCELQGHGVFLFKIDEKVRFRPNAETLDSKDWISGKIIGIKIELKTHKIKYRIEEILPYTVRREPDSAWRESRDMENEI